MFSAPAHGVVVGRDRSNGIPSDPVTPLRGIREKLGATRVCYAIGSDLAAVLRETLVRLDNLWRMPCPYVMVLHQAPTHGSGHPGFHFHVQIHPPLRRPGLLEYLAGPEIGGGNFLNDTAPDATAAELRAVPAVRYTHAADG